MSLSKWEYVLVVAVLAGSVVSVHDYLLWKHAETQNFGTGPTTNQKIADSLNLDGRYQNMLVRLRQSYPSSWKVAENPATSDPKHPPVITSRVQIVHFVAGKDVDFSITAEKTDLNLVDFVNSAASKVTLEKEREYISTAKTTVTVLTWISGLNTHQAGYIKVGDIVFTLFSQSPTNDWATYEKTFWQMYSSFLPL